MLIPLLVALTLAVPGPHAHTSSSPQDLRTSRPLVLKTSSPQDLKSPSPRVIRVSAERFAFTPNEIVVDKGTMVEFHLTSDDTDHGFRIVGTDVNVEIPKRRRGETVIKYLADTAGEFRIECSRPCGAGHTAMTAILKVR